MLLTVVLGCAGTIIECVECATKQMEILSVGKVNQTATFIYIAYTFYKNLV
jgi:hypothetical protein